MAVRIMNRHELERAEVERPLDKVTYRIISLARQRVRLYQRLIASLLSRHFNVRLIHSRIYDPEADAVCRSFEIFGRRDYVEIAEYCYHFWNTDWRRSGMPTAMVFQGGTRDEEQLLLRGAARVRTEPDPESKR